MKPSVLLVGADQPFFEALEVRLTQSQFEIARSLSGDDMPALISRMHTDAAIVDSDLPDMRSLKLCRQLYAEASSTPLLICTDRCLALQAVLFYDAGACDYFEKSVDWVIIEAKIRAALRRYERCPCRDRAWLATACAYNPSSSCGADTTPPVSWRDLTRLEARLLGILAATPGRTVSTADIALELWGQTRVGSKSLYEHVSSLRAKLLPVGWAIVNVRGSGYRLQPLAAISRTRVDD